MSILIKGFLTSEKAVVTLFHLHEVQKQEKLTSDRRIQERGGGWWVVAGSVRARRGHEGVSWGSGSVLCLDPAGSYGRVVISSNLLGCTLKIYALYCMSVVF